MKLNNKNYANFSTDCIKCNPIFYVYINLFYYTINSLISQNINIILFNYILIFNILHNLKCIYTYITIQMYIYLYNLMNYQNLNIYYFAYNIYLRISIYCKYSITGIYFKPIRNIKNNIYGTYKYLNILIKNIMFFLKHRNIPIIIFLIIIVGVLIHITPYISILISLLYSCFNLDFFVLKFLAILLLFIYESLIHLVYNFYFNIIISIIYLNYETIFYLFNEFFWDFTEGAYQLLFYINEFLNLIFGAISVFTAPQSSLNSFDTIVLNLYEAYLRVITFFYFSRNSLLHYYVNLFALDTQIFVFFDSYTSYKNFIFNNVGGVILYGAERVAFFVDFNGVDAVSFLGSSWFIFFYTASLSITKSLVILTLMWAPFNFCTFLIFDYWFFLTAAFQYYWNVSISSVFFLVIFEEVSYFLSGIVWVSFLFKWIFLNLLIIVYSSVWNAFSVTSNFLSWGWPDEFFMFLEIYLVNVGCVCTDIFIGSRDYSWIFWLNFSTLKSMYFSAIYCFYVIWVLFSQVLGFFFGEFYWVVAAFILGTVDIVLSCVFNFLDYFWCIFDFFNIFNIFWYFILNYYYLFSVIWGLWFTLLQFTANSVFFSTYIIYLGLCVVLVGSLFYYSSLIVVDYSSPISLWRRWPVFLKNFFVFDNYLADRRISMVVGTCQPCAVLPVYAIASAKGLIKLDNFNSFGRINSTINVVASSYFMLLAYFYCFLLIRNVSVNLMRVACSGVGDFDWAFFTAWVTNFRKFICAVFYVYSNTLLVRYITHSEITLGGSSVFFGKWRFSARNYFSTFSVSVIILSFSVLATLILENCYWLNDKSIFYLQKGQLTSVSHLNAYMSTPLRTHFGYNYIRENLRLAYNARFLEEFAGSQIRFLGEFYKPKALLHNYFILNPQDFLMSNNAILSSKKIINKFGVGEVQDLLFKGRLDYFLKFRTLWFFSYLNWLVYQYDVFSPPTTLQFFLPWRVFLLADYVSQFIALGWIFDLLEGVFSWYRGMFFDFLPFLRDLPAVNSIYLDFELANFLLWGFRGNNFKFNPRVYYGQWVSNPLLSLRWHYATYLKSRAWYTRRGASIRELYFLINPYKIFEDINDFPIFYNTLFDDGQIRLGGAFRSPFLYKNFFRPKLLFGYKWNAGDFFGSGLNVFTTALSKNFYLGSSFVDTTFKRQYNSFLGLSNSDKLINRVNGLGVWSASSNVYDMFLRHFYYKYWAAKQAYSQKFLAYDKIQFFKKFRFSRVRLGFVSNANKSPNLLRFDVYNQDYLNSQLAFFFKTFSVNSDVFFQKQGGKQYFDFSGFSFFSDFRSFKSIWLGFFLDYGWTAVGEACITLFDYCTRLLFICIFRFFEFFAFFNLPVRVLVPFNLKLQTFNFLNYGAVDLELISRVREIQARSFIFFHTNLYKNRVGSLNHSFSYLLGNSFL